MPLNMICCVTRHKDKLAIGSKGQLLFNLKKDMSFFKNITSKETSNIKNIVIITAGFKETGVEGKKREEELKKIITENNLNVIGPNCLGILNAEISLNCSFAKDIPISGDIALISQSGAVIDAIIDWSFKEKIGFSKIVSLGNMAGIDELKMLEYLKDDPKTKSIVFYMETLEKGKEFGF